MNTPYEQPFDLVRSQRRKKRQKTAVHFLLSLYEGRRVCLHALRAFPKEQRQWFLSVMEDYLKDTPAWIKQHRAS
ncbi:MAG: hypothetical protein GY807_21585, partial [Gammaproteobacteria bacterium]|nr:hypothetical protein [Gammaproteobacteria bacterium]